MSTNSSTKKYILLAVVMVLLVIGGIYLGMKNLSVSSGAEVEPRTFGFIGILSGDYAVIGENIKNGVVLANEIYNRTHPKTPVSLVIEDDGFSGGKGMSAFQKLISVDKVDGLINTSTPTIDAIYEIAVKQDLPIIQIGEQGREPEVDNVFGIFPNSIASEYDYGVYLRNKGIKEMTMVYTKNDAMIRFVESFKKGFAGKTIDIATDPSEKDFRTHALKASQNNPGTVGIFMFPQQGAQFVKELIKVSKSKPQLFFDANFVSGQTDYKRILGDMSVLDGTLIGNIESSISDEFKLEYKARYGTEPGFLADMGYDAFMVLVDNHSNDSSKWIESISKLNHKGVSGVINFDEKGNRKPKTKMMVIRSGEIAEIR